MEPTASGFKAPGRAWRPIGQPEPVRVHDFIVPEKGKAISYGIYDLTRNRVGQRRHRS